MNSDKVINDAGINDGRFVVVTGASSGIGLCAAQALHAKKYQVIATVRREYDKNMLHQKGIEHVVLMDLCESESVNLAIKKIQKITLNSLYAVFNNAAFGQPGAVEDLSRECLRAQFEANFFGTHQLTVGLLPELLKQPSARIIQNSSILGFAAMPWRGAYNASKFALEGLSDTLRLELRGSNVRVSLIEPGPITSRFRVNALKALKEHINIESSRHSDAYQKSIERLDRVGSGSFTLPPEAVVSRVIHALESSRPKARYYVTFPTYLVAALRHVLPTKVLDALLCRLG